MSRMTRLLALLGLTAPASAAELQALDPVPFTAVKLVDSFWAPRIKQARDVTIPHCFQQCEETGRLSNFDKAAGKTPGAFEGLLFNDSDVYKVIEGAAYALQQQPDARLQAYCDELISRIAAAQQPDGYLNTYFILNPDQPRWGDIAHKHEMYCAGHLLEAGIAYFQATGRRELLDVATRLVEHIMALFGPGKRTEPPGHQELELALVKLYRLTGERRVLEQARFFIEQRGVANGRALYGEYAQDHLPIREQSTIVGHAVRGMYFVSGVCDVAALTGDESYLPALKRIWADTFETKMYVTGGLGSSAQNEGFTAQYDLPNETAYCETCAAIASVYWNHRMNLLTGEARYADVLERALYNNVLAGVSLSGNRFFYDNPLASRGDHHRVSWFRCACCPPNVARLIPSVSGYVYAARGAEIYVNLYAASEATLALKAGMQVRLIQQTNYPWDGRIRLAISPATPAEFAVRVRIPGWLAPSEPDVVAALQLHVDGAAPTPQEVTRSNGYLVIRREWRPDSSIELEFPMPPQRVVANPRVEADRGRVALQRGPLVYCVEGVDNDGNVAGLCLPAGAPLSHRWAPDLLGGVVTLTADAVRSAPAPVDWREPLYTAAPAAQPVSLTAIPYYAWDNRTSEAQPAGGMQMLVWLPETSRLMSDGPVSWLTAAASHCWRADSLSAMHDRRLPANSADGSIPRFTWWPRRGDAQWAQYDFRAPREVSSVSLYWFDDTRRGGGCAAPLSWRLLARHAGEWREVQASGPAGVELDGFNTLSFQPITTDGLRIEVQLREERSAGILEWRVN